MLRQWIVQRRSSSTRSVHCLGASLVAGCVAALAPRSALGLTAQSFEGDARDTPYVLLNASAPGPSAEVVTEGANHFLRLAAAGPFPSHNTLTFGPAESVISRLLVDFDFRITPVTGKADGIAFAFLDGAAYRAPAVPPPAVAEEPAFARSLAVALDVYQSPSEPPGQHVSIHYGDQVFAFSGAAIPELASGAWINARVIIEFGDGGAWLSVALRPQGESACAAVERFKIHGVLPYAGRVWFGARAGGILSNFDLDNVRVETTDPSLAGAWSVAQCGPAVPIHAVLLPDGRILTADRHDYSMTPGPWILDPDTGAAESAAEPGYDLFCAGHTHVDGGKIVFAGGHWFDNVGVDRASLYDSGRDRWFDLPQLNDGRWYPTTTALGDGSVLVLSGAITPTLGANPLPQVLEPGLQSIRDLRGAERILPLYPWVFSAPDGRAFVAGPAPLSLFLSTYGTGAFQQGVASVEGFRDYGSAVSYDAGRILKAGGSECSLGDCVAAGGDRLAPTAGAEIIDLNAPVPEWAPTGAMHSPRRQFTLVTLADGSVLAVGGTQSAGFSDGAGSVLVPELWTPSARTWRELERAQVPRLYHNTALLLPDARVWTGGGGHPRSDNGGGDQQDFEIFSPPYLHTGRPRPEILEIPAELHHGETFTARIRSASTPVVNLARLGAVTHDFDQSALFIAGLAVRPVAGALETYAISLPDNANLAPPGPYMLFAIDAGVPSRAAVIELGRETTSTAPPRTNDVEGGGEEGGMAGAGCRFAPSARLLPSQSIWALWLLGAALLRRWWLPGKMRRNPTGNPASEAFRSFAR